MENELSLLVRMIKSHLSGPEKIKSLITKFSQNKRVMQYLLGLKLENGWELYRDEEGFILTAYSELAGKYREPHNHGRGWVIYVVVTGEVEMGSYRIGSDGKLSLQQKINLTSGVGQIYQVGDVHDTCCLSDKSIILRFTSCDLKLEEQAGRMMRFNLEKGV